MPRLRTVSPSDPGWTRVRHGRGHRYLDVDGSPLPAEDVERVKSLVIPPAWREVWICPHPNGHLQAVGTDEAGRRQYLYHPYWRQKRDEAKFDRVIEMAGQLPRVRSTLRRELKDGELDRVSALATAVRLVDLGLFRLGSDTYTEQNGSYGLTTLERRHVSADDDSRRFCFVGKSGVEHEICLTDPLVIPLVDKMTRRRPRDARVLSARDGRRWVPLSAADINEYLRELFGMEVSAKDFRTWHATVHVARWVGAAEPGRDQAQAHPRGPRGRRQRLGAARQHPDGVPLLLRGPAGDRPVRVGHHDPPRRRRARPGVGPRAQPGRRGGRRAAHRLSGGCHSAGVSRSTSSR